MGEGASPHPPSPRRSRGENSGGGEERPRFFDQKAKNKCWANAETVPGRHPERWRKDGAGNIVCKRFFNCYGCLCFEYDHIVPFSKGGESTAENCQILQTRVNRLKAAQDKLDKTQLRGFSCDIQFTGKFALLFSLLLSP
uniref:HNH domain-containing protein n=1 Tax=Rhizophora mucronata TaxID=61149 RepID=A0A2P2JIQ1_RHIMU